MRYDLEELTDSVNTLVVWDSDEIPMVCGHEEDVEQLVGGLEDEIRGILLNEINNNEGDTLIKAEYSNNDLNGDVEFEKSEF